jgi:hypothetical protein
MFYRPVISVDRLTLGMLMTQRGGVVDEIGGDIERDG